MKESAFTPREKRILADAAAERYEGMKGARFYRNLDFLVYISAVIVLALSIRTFLVEPIRVKGDSMVPTLVSTEHMFVEKVSYWFAPPKRGEIVICYYPGYTESCVKRVVGLPGETVSVSGGRVYIDNVPLNESGYWNDRIVTDTAPVTVGAKQVFVMGDNRNGSKDSRSASVGCIPYGKVVGRVRAVIWPLSLARGIAPVAY